jgi:hypothetical protein
MMGTHRANVNSNSSSSNNNNNRAKGSTTREPMKNRDMLLVLLVCNIVLLNAFTVSIMLNEQDARLFSFGWTYCLNSKESSENLSDNVKQIVDIYNSN